MQSRRVGYLAWVILLAAAYFGAGKLGLFLAVPPGVATPVWPPSGVALAAVLILGKRIWPGIWVGSFLVNVGVFLESSVSPETAWLAILEACCIATGSTGQALLGGWLIARSGGHNPLERVQEVFRFAVQAGLLSCMVSATIGVTSLCATGLAPWSIWPVNWMIWWLGDTLGVLIVTPVLLAWNERTPLERRQRWLELVACLTLVLWLGVLVFNSSPTSSFSSKPLVFLFIPFLAWAALRFGQQEAMLVFLAIGGMSVFGTVRGAGPFASGSSHQALLALELFLAVAALTALSIAAMVNERQVVETSWRRVTDELETRVQERTAELVRANAALTAEIAERRRAELALQETARRLETLVEFAKALASSRDLDTLLDWVVARLVEVIPSAEFGMLCTFDPATQTLVPRACRGLDPEWLQKVRLKPGESVAGRVFQTGQPMMVQSAAEYESLWREIPPETRENLRRAQNNQLLRGVICTPIRSPSGETFGVVGLGSARSMFQNSDLELLQGVAGLAGAAIENARLLQQARDAEQRYRLIFENSVEGIFQSTPDGRFLQANPALARMLGYDSPEQLLLEVNDIEQQLCVDPSQRAEFKRLIEQQGQVFGFEFLDRTKDGRLIWISKNARCVRGDDGTLLYYEGTVQDITDRRRAENALRESETRFRMLAEMAPAAIGIYQGTKFVYCNPALRTATGYSSQELGAMNFWDIAHPDFREVYQERGLARQRGIEVPLRYEVPLLTKYGEVRWMDFSAVTIELQGQPAVVGIGYDITDRKSSEAALRDYTERLQVLSRRLLEVQEVERRHLARELHDEIGQVLTAIALNLHALRETVGPIALPRLEDCRRIVDDTIQQVRNLSLDLRPSALDDFGLEAALRWYLNRFGQRAGLEVEFVSDLAGERLAPELESTCFRIAQEALTNVARHAQARQVTLELRRQAAELFLAVSDDGVGFDVASTRNGAAPDESFGLLGMHERVELIGGRLEIDSARGRGTRIRVRISTPSEQRERYDHENHPSAVGRRP